MKKKAKAKRRIEDIEEDRLLSAAAKLLRRKGWNPVVIGGMRVEQEAAFKFRLSIGFSGTKKEDRETP